MSTHAKLLPGGEVSYDVYDAEHPSGEFRVDLAQFRQLYGEVISLESEHQRDALLESIDAHKLHGRGGAHFPSAIKIRSVLAAGGGGHVIANAAEGEPSAAKDAALWQTNPHLVLRGLRAVGRLVNAEHLGIWVHEDSRATKRSIENALTDEPIANPTVQVYLSPHHYVSGEASAIINAVQGGPAVPKFFPSKARAWGEGNAPVLVFNTETLAHIGLLASESAGEYHERTLITVLVPGRRNVSEVDADTTFSEVMPLTRSPQAVLLGGYGGQWVRWSVIAEMPIEQQSLHAQGLSLGAGIIGALPEDMCGVRETARITDWMASQSAQQCGPCVYGLNWLADEMHTLSEGGHAVKGALARMHERLPQLMKRGACSHPDGVVTMVKSSLMVFAEEIELHRNGQCSATYLRPFFPTTTEVHA